MEVTFDMVREEFLPNTVTRNGKSPRYTRENFQAYLRNPQAYLTFEEEMRKKEEMKQFKSEFPPPVITPYQITIRHGETFTQRIKRLACSWLNPWIGEHNTPVAVDKKKGSEDKEVFAVHFDRPIESDDAVAALAALDPPLKPAMHEDLIAFGADHPDVQGKFPVVQLGSSWERPGYGRVVSSLYRFGSACVLSLRVWHGEWSAYCRFLAVPA